MTGQNIPVEKWSGAVVMLLVNGKLAMIRRSESMPTHKGQIGFLGGHKNLKETEPAETAVREFCEESGFTSSKVNTLGLIYPVWSSHKRLIVPVLSSFCGSEQEFLEGVKSNGEWDNIVLVPLDYLANDLIWSFANIYAPTMYPVYFCSLSTESCTYLCENISDPYILWGASAKMVLNFFQKHNVNDKNAIK